MKRKHLVLIILCYSICSFAQEQGIPVLKPHQLKWYEAGFELWQSGNNYTKVHCAYIYRIAGYYQF